MENLELIISLASAALGLLATTATFLAKFIKNAKLKNFRKILFNNIRSIQMITYDRPYQTQAHIHSLNGAMDEITVLGEDKQGNQPKYYLNCYGEINSDMDNFFDFYRYGEYIGYDCAHEYSEGIIEVYR